MPHFVVANFTHEPGPSGAWRRLLGMLREMPQQLAGNESISLLINDDAPLPTLPSAIRILPIAIPRRPSWRRAHAESKLLPTLVADLGASVLDLSTLPVSARIGCPVVLTIHDLRDLTPRLARRPRFLTRFVLKRALGRAARLIVPSRFIAREVRGRFGDRAPPMAIVGGGLDPTWFCDADRATSRPASLPYRYLHVGHLERRKNVALLLDAMAILHSALRASGRPPPILELIGRDHGEGPSLRARARRLAIDDHVVWHGEVDDRFLLDRYRAATAVLFPSRHEGLGIPALEALAMGAVLFVADGTATADLVAAHATILPPDDPAAWAKALALAASAPEQTASRDAAITFARSHGADRAAARVLEVWRSVTWLSRTGDRGVRGQ